MVTAYRASSHLHKPGDTLARPRGFRVATSVDGACAGADWPLHVYEVEVNATELRGDGSEMRARSCRIVRQLPPEEVLGPRAPEILAIFDRIPCVGWCRPVEREPEEAWVSMRVEEHMEALAACTSQQAVKFADVRNLNEVKMIADDFIRSQLEGSVAYRPDLFAVIRDEPARRNARVAAGRAAAKAMFAALWDPLWSALRVLAEIPPFAIGGRDMAVAREALAAACGPAKERAQDFVLALAAGESVGAQRITEAKHPAVEALARVVADRGWDGNAPLCEAAMLALVVIWDRTWMSAARMAATASACVQLLVNDNRGPNPWGPLLDMWLAGGVPVVEIEGTWIVYWCCAFE
jgi:hypothetical protein